MHYLRKNQSVKIFALIFSLIKRFFSLVKSVGNAYFTYRQKILSIKSINNVYFTYPQKYSSIKFVDNAYFSYQQKNLSIKSLDKWIYTTDEKSIDKTNKNFPSHFCPLSAREKYYMFFSLLQVFIFIAQGNFIFSHFSVSTPPQQLQVRSPPSPFSPAIVFVQSSRHHLRSVRSFLFFLFCRKK